MLELEVYAAGVRDLDKIPELDHQFAAIPGLRYKVAELRPKTKTQPLGV
jgi:hypothetical protein